MICPHCGSHVADGSAFCSSCGKAIPAVPGSADAASGAYAPVGTGVAQVSASAPGAAQAAQGDQATQGAQAAQNAQAVQNAQAAQGIPGSYQGAYGYGQQNAWMGSAQGAQWGERPRLGISVSAQKLAFLPTAIIGLFVFIFMFLPWVNSPLAIVEKNVGSYSFASKVKLSAMVGAAPNMYANWFDETGMTSGGHTAVLVFAWIFFALWIVALILMLAGVIGAVMGTGKGMHIAKLAFTYVAVFAFAWVIFVYLASSTTYLPFISTGWVVTTFVLSLVGVALSASYAGTSLLGGRR